MSDHPIIEQVRELRYDLTAMQGKVSDLLRNLAALELEPPERFECSSCPVAFRGPKALAEHVYTSHDGPVPAHWQEAESRSEEAAA